MASPAKLASAREGRDTACGPGVGFYNPFCRDNVAADPAAWPETALLVS